MVAVKVLHFTADERFDLSQTIVAAILMRHVNITLPNTDLRELSSILFVLSLWNYRFLFVIFQYLAIDFNGLVVLYLFE